jgi:hypothetical protein
MENSLSQFYQEFAFDQEYEEWIMNAGQFSNNFNAQHHEEL